MGRLLLLDRPELEISDGSGRSREATVPPASGARGMGCHRREVAPGQFKRLVDCTLSELEAASEIDARRQALQGEIANLRRRAHRDRAVLPGWLRRFHPTARTTISEFQVVRDELVSCCCRRTGRRPRSTAKDRSRMNPDELTAVNASTLTVAG